MPVGFENETNGALNVAVNAMKSAAQAHHFMGVDPQGQVSVVTTIGNSDGHIILRGGQSPNYGPEALSECQKVLEKNQLNNSIVVDCSHGNSNKDFSRQPLVTSSVLKQINKGNASIIGLMLESNLHEGQQDVTLPVNDLKYGVSVTDACIGCPLLA